MNNKPHITIITNYYPPEIGAASNRIFHLAHGLRSDYKVRVIAPLPNYPTGKIFKEFRNRLISKTIEDDIEIHRLWIFASSSKNKFLRLLAMLSFSLSLWIYFLTSAKSKKFIIQSPPLLVAFSSIFFLKSKKRTLILNVSDLWPSAGLDLGALKRNWFYRLLECIEHYNYSKADIILGQSDEILSHVTKINPKSKTLLYRNYPIVHPPEINPQSKMKQVKSIVYAGLLGYAQGILRLCQELDFEGIELHIYGSGPEEEEIRKFLASNQGLPIVLHGTLERNLLHVELAKYDIAIVPLLKRIYGSVPSKIFELAKLGLPILYFGGGEGESIIAKHNLGWIAESGNYYDLNKKIKLIKLDEVGLEKKRKIQRTAMKVFSFEMQLAILKDSI